LSQAKWSYCVQKLQNGWKFKKRSHEKQQETMKLYKAGVNGWLYTCIDSNAFWWLRFSFPSAFELRHKSFFGQMTFPLLMKL
jgi:hypothetical protein